MRQRVAIARGLAQDPRLILMDEPFAALDEQTRTRMGHDLLDIWEKTRKTVFFITHSLTEAIYLSDVVLVMSARPGRILETIAIDFPRPRDARSHRQRGVRTHPQPHLASDRRRQHGEQGVIRPRTVKALGIAVVALALWEAIVRLGLVNQIILAAPSDVVAGRHHGWRHVPARLRARRSSRSSLAIVIAWTLGIAVGVDCRQLASAGSGD